MEQAHPCMGCFHWYGLYPVNRCCNYIFDTGHRRPCPPGDGCTEKITEAEGRARGYRKTNELI